jgi:hypothetical protein
MPEDRAKGPPPAFPELELDLGPVRSAKPAAAVEDDEPRELAMELDAPAPKPRDPGAQAAALAAQAMGPPVSIRSAPTPMGPPSTAGATDPLRGPSTPAGPPSTRMGPPPGYAVGPSAPPSGAPVVVTQPPPSAASALMARAKSAAEDPGAVARNVAEVGNRTSTALVMLGGAILLTLLDVIYSRVTGERFSIGGLKLVWIAAPLAVIGGAVLGVRLLKERLE